MSGVAQPLPPEPQQLGVEDRLDSWKEIAAYLKRSLRTVRRWESEQGLPVHRHLHQRQGTVYAYKPELDAWWDVRGARLETEPRSHPDTPLPEPAFSPLGASRKAAVVALGLAVAAALSLAVYWISRPETKPPLAEDNRVMLAVLPFENLSVDSEQEFFSDGLTEELITELGRLDPERMGVIARTSSMQYKGAKKRANEIARELGVNYLVEGSVRREGEHVRIAAQLIRASDQTHLWAENYDRTLRDALTVQADVARAVAERIEMRLSESRGMALAAGSHVAPEAHEAYLKGRYSLERRTRESVLSARQWFERAIALEPNYAAAFVGLADSHVLAVTYADAVPEDAMRQARQAVQKALVLDERLPEAHAWLGVILAEYDWDWAGAESAFRRAIELDPNFAYAHKLYAEYLSYVGNFEKAVAEARLARRLDPLSVVMHSMLGFVLYRARRYNEVPEALAETVKFNPGHPLPYLALGLAYAQLRRYEEAIAALEKARSLTGDNSEMVAQLGYVHARAGRVVEARRLLTELEARANVQYVAPFHFAIIHSGLGETAPAMDWLERGFQQRHWLMCVVKTDPIFDPLRSEPRFHALLRKMNFPGSVSPRNNWLLR